MAIKHEQISSTPTLRRTLGPLMLWGLGVGYVISGMYFGWNLGLAEGGPKGLAIATFFIILLYITFTFSYTELACAIPKAGGVFDYATRGLNREWGFVAGMAQLIEFLFAPPAIAAAIGAYFNIFFPQIPVTVIAIFAYLFFTGLNILGVRAAAGFELVITIFAVFELLLFAGICFPHFSYANLRHNDFPHGWKGVWAAVPFAIWFFLGLEGVANVAEETIRPQRNVLLGFGSALATLIVLCVLVFVSSIGVAGWEAIVYPVAGKADTSNSPLPLALSKITGSGGAMYHLLITIGLMGLVASFHGIILAASRATFEFGRVKYIPAAFGRVNSRTRTPVNALVINMCIGIIALLTGRTDEIITISCFGALTLFILAMVTLLALRKKEPELERPFKTPLYPYFPIVALVIAVVALVAMILLYINLSLIYFSILAVSYIWFKYVTARGGSTDRSDISYNKKVG
ncbi:MAG TPA: ethanolamine permease [Puia sp.]|nr:ethanolamine permease [Puia sp.]